MFSGPRHLGYGASWLGSSLPLLTQIALGRRERPDCTLQRLLPRAVRSMSHGVFTFRKLLCFSSAHLPPPLRGISSALLLRAEVFHPSSASRFIRWTDVEEMVKIVYLCQQTSLSLVLFICRWRYCPYCIVRGMLLHTRLALSDSGIVT